MFLLSTPSQEAFGKYLPSEGRSEPKKKRRDPTEEKSHGHCQDDGRRKPEEETLQRAWGQPVSAGQRHPRVLKASILPEDLVIH